VFYDCRRVNVSNLVLPYDLLVFINVTMYRVVVCIVLFACLFYATFNLPNITLTLYQNIRSKFSKRKIEVTLNHCCLCGVTQNSKILVDQSFSKSRTNVHVFLFILKIDLNKMRIDLKGSLLRCTK
jgi:hypothetical protein